MSSSSATPGPFPLQPLPFPSFSSSRRARARANRARHITSTCNTISTSLNDLHFSFVSKRDSFISSSSFSFSPAVVTRTSAHLRSCSERWVDATRPSDLDPLDVSEGVLPVHSHSRAALLDTYASSPGLVALKADAVSLPSSAATASLSDVLPPDLALFYSNPANVLRRPCEHIPAAAAAPVQDQREYEKLVVRLREKGMVTFTRTPAIINGVFVVPKDPDSQRLIIDARRANAIFAEPAHCELPTPDLFGRLTVDDGNHFYVAGAYCNACMSISSFPAPHFLATIALVARPTRASTVYDIPSTSMTSLYWVLMLNRWCGCS